VRTVFLRVEATVGINVHIIFGGNGTKLCVFALEEGRKARQIQEITSFFSVVYHQC
jgi:hypothetical protein